MISEQDYIDSADFERELGIKISPQQIAVDRRIALQVALKECFMVPLPEDDDLFGELLRNVFKGIEI